MLDNLFVLNNSGEVILEKQWRGHGGDRSICAWFFERLRSYSEPRDAPSVMSAPQSYVFHIYKGELIYVACCSDEMPPLMAIEMLQRLHGTLERYFGIVTEDALRDNFVTVYEVMEEMYDFGTPLISECSAVQSLVPPKTIMSQVANVVGSGKSSTLDFSSFSDLPSSVPWRTSDTKHVNNEAIFEITETLDLVMDRDGKMLRSAITGELNAICRLSGIPELTVRFASATHPSSASSFTSVQFHPCVRIRDWESKRILSFIPPEGSFQLMRYRIKGIEKPLMYVKPQIDFCDNIGHVNVVMGINNPPKPLESILVCMPLPAATVSADLVCNHGSLLVNISRKICTWTMDNLLKDRVVSLSGTLRTEDCGHGQASSSPIRVNFIMNGAAASGTKLGDVSLRKSPPKGNFNHYFKAKSTLGSIEIRT